MFLIAVRDRVAWHELPARVNYINTALDFIVAVRPHAPATIASPMMALARAMLIIVAQQDAGRENAAKSAITTRNISRPAR